MATKTVSEQWRIQETTKLTELVIEQGGSIKAPWGKGVTLFVDGVPTQIAPGKFEGDILLYVGDSYLSKVGIWGTPQKTFYRTGIFLQDNKVVDEYSIPQAVKGGTITGTTVEDVTIEANDGGLNGIFITVEGDYTLNNIKMNLVGRGENDFQACGAGLAIYGDAKVTVNDSEFIVKGVTRGAIFAGNNSELTVNRTRIIGESAPFDDKVDPNWSMSLYGTNRITNAGHMATCYYNDCFISTNGWGAMSVDGGKYNHLFYKNCVIMQTSPSGYGAMGIADNFNDYAEYDGLADPRCLHSFDNCVVTVGGMALICCTNNSSGEFKNGCIVNSRRWGTETFRNDGGYLNISDSTFYTGSSAMVVKGSRFTINVDNAKFFPGNDVILQLQDNDDPGMGGPMSFRVPVDRVDEYVAGRDLTVADPANDVVLNIANSAVKGDIYNSTTNLFAIFDQPKDTDVYDPLPKMGPPPMPKPDPDDPEPFSPEEMGGIPGDVVKGAGGFDSYLQGAKNLEVTLTNASVNGAISAASQKYGEGVFFIDKRNRDEVNNIVQTPAPVVNNGVILSVDGKSTWTVTKTSYLSKLVLAEGGKIVAPKGASVALFVDGKATPIAAGTYTGAITVEVK
jgi:hypothetical protein